LAAQTPRPILSLSQWIFHCAGSSVLGCPTPSNTVTFAIDLPSRWKLWIWLPKPNTVTFAMNLPLHGKLCFFEFATTGQGVSPAKMKISSLELHSRTPGEEAFPRVASCPKIPPSSYLEHSLSLGEFYFFSPFMCFKSVLAFLPYVKLARFILSK
jgi:hypothetical protein